MRTALDAGIWRSLGHRHLLSFAPSRLGPASAIRRTPHAAFALPPVSHRSAVAHGPLLCHVLSLQHGPALTQAPTHPHSTRSRAKSTETKCQPLHGSGHPTAFLGWPPWTQLFSGGEFGGSADFQEQTRYFSVQRRAAPAPPAFLCFVHGGDVSSVPVRDSPPPPNGYSPYIGGT